MHRSPNETQQQDFHPATLEQSNTVVEVQLAVTRDRLCPADDVMQLQLAQTEDGRRDARFRIRL